MEDLAAAVPDFPKSALVPKTATGVERFLQQYPQWDGNGVVVAVFDTGVDPNASGLKETSDGKPKIVDLIDTTGSGDVDTSCVRKTTDSRNRVIDSLDGRPIEIPDDWSNPTGEWHVGLKNDNDLLPSSVKTRLKEKFNREVLIPKKSQWKAQAMKKLDDFNSKHTDTSSSLELKLQKEDLEANIELLDSISNETEHPGTALDCIVFHDGDSWSVGIIRSWADKKEYCDVLKPFRESQQTSKLGDVTLSINIYEEGNLLCLVTPAGAHGTHVASIIAANDRECPDMNGVAPGAQIISFKIGDTRLGTMETASSLMRACSMAVSCGVHIINFSYGEASHWTNKGAVLEMMSELCVKHNIVFVASAGNNGPALSTVGCPGGNTSGLIGVGAYVTPEMMSGEYAMTHTKPGLPYTWSSRGPSTDGDLGVSVTAPGGAITSVPVWTWKKKQLMNGTSMSSPHVAGCVALLLSALKDTKVPYSPNFIKRMLENTAKPLGKHDHFSIGQGVIQVDKAYDVIKDLPSSLVNIQVRVSGGRGRGIYLREPHEVTKLCRIVIAVEPQFPTDADTAEKVDFELQLTLLSSESWVLPPKYLLLWNGVRQFTVEVNPTNLPSGVHFAEVTAVVPGNQSGPIFRIPITVIIPEMLTNPEMGVFTVPVLKLSKDFAKRYFFHVPKDATWADIRLSNIECDSKSRITVHSVQLLPERSYRENEEKQMVTVERGGTSELVIPVLDGYTLEVCFVPYWSELRDVTFSLDIVFRSVQPTHTSITFNSSNMWTSIGVTSYLQDEQVFPEFRLTHSTMYKRPESHKIMSLGPRDITPNGVQIYQLTLSYKFHISQSTEVRPEFPMLSDLLYENPYCGQLWMVFNSRKQYQFTGDAYTRHYSTKLVKDDYTLRLQVCHQKPDQLKKLTDMPLCLHLKLLSSLKLEVTSSRYDLFSSSTITSKTLKLGIRTNLFLCKLPEEKLSKCSVREGDILSGRFTFSKDEKIKKKIHYKLQYMVGPQKGSKSTSVPAKKEYSQETYENSLRDFKMEWMKNGVVKADELEGVYGADVSFLLLKLRMLSEGENVSVVDVEELTIAIYSEINMKEILAALAVQTSFCEAKEREKLEERKAQLVECLLLEGSVLLKEQPSSTRLNTVYIDLHTLLGSKDDKLRAFKMKYAETYYHFALLGKFIKEESSSQDLKKAQEEKLVQVYRQLKYNVYADILEQALIWKYPPDFLPF